MSVSLGNTGASKRRMNRKPRLDMAWSMSQGQLVQKSLLFFESFLDARVIRKFPTTAIRLFRLLQQPDEALQPKVLRKLEIPQANGD